MCEPLRGKKRLQGISRTEKRKIYFYFDDDVKSAVEGLLKSISILKQPCDKDEVYDLVEKWFEDVIDDAD